MIEYMKPAVASNLQAKTKAEEHPINPKKKDDDGGVSAARSAESTEESITDNMVADNFSRVIGDVALLRIKANGNLMFILESE